jgi:hypothetical protein
MHAKVHGLAVFLPLLAAASCENLLSQQRDAASSSSAAPANAGQESAGAGGADTDAGDMGGSPAEAGASPGGSAGGTAGAGDSGTLAVADAGAPAAFWGGLKLIELDDMGQRAGDSLVAIAGRPNNGGAIEAPFVVHRCGYFYLFASFDRCCDGANSTYKIMVGRSTALAGPYTDRDGTPWNPHVERRGLLARERRRRLARSRAQRRDREQ